MPPNWAMPASKETRVRVEGLSKIMARILPFRGVCVHPAVMQGLQFPGPGQQGFDLFPAQVQYGQQVSFHGNVSLVA